MTGKSPTPADLFGNPWEPPRDPRGRKSHRPTAQGREIVAQLRGGGATDEEIALQLGLSQPTLRKYYFRELDHGASLARNEVMRRLYEKAMAGNVTAMRAYLAETQKGAAAEVMRGPRAAKAQPLGKKEERRQAASQIGGRYSPRPAPKLTH